jgi:DNA gyrase subunit A
MQLGRLTRFSRLELEKEQETLRREIEELEAILNDEALLKKVVSDELLEVSKTYGTPRRTVLLETAGTPVAAQAAPLEVADDPCFAFLSSSGLLARTSSAEPVGDGGDRTNHDVIVSTVATTARGEVGLLTSRGRLVRLSVLDLPGLPASANDPNLQGGYPVSEIASLEPGERALALCALTTDGAGLALGTKDGIVKRVNPEVIGKDEWDVIGLKDGDEVVGAVQLTTGHETLCFITTDAQLLHFGADGVRPQGRSGGGMQGIRVSAGERVAWFGALDPADAVVVTSSGSTTALPGTEPGAVKVTPFSEYPAKGRATGGVRCHRFLKGEDTLVFAWAGDAPARAAAASGAPVDLPAADGRRDGSGTPGTQPIAAAAGPVGVRLARLVQG